MRSTGTTGPPAAAGCGTSLLRALGERVRRERRRRSWSRVELAERSGLSVRFLARIESGSGNLSVRRLAALAAALGTTADELLRPAADTPRILALVGMRGAGKSTVGPLVARRTGVPFVEMDARIAEEAGLSLGELFELHGEGYYRRLEQSVLRRLLAGGGPAVLAAAGGVVNEPETWRMLLERAAVVWLRARPEDHWNRVVAQGDSRPMADNPAAMQQLRELLAAREPTYAAAPHAVDTSDRSPAEVAEWIAARVAARLWAGRGARDG